MIKRKNKCRKNNRKHNMQEGDGKKVIVENEGVTIGHKRSTCDRRNDEGKKGSECRCVE